MARWQPDSRGRLQRAALELYGERGFEATTVAEIAERAGVTERTFFRHFADKHEVLFAGSEELEGLLAEGVAAAPASAPPLQAVAAGFAPVAAMLEERGEYPRRRQAVIEANRELQERELMKLAALTAALAAALRARGVEEPGASLAAEAGVAVFRVAFEQWVAPGGRESFAALLEAGFAELRAVAGASS